MPDSNALVLTDSEGNTLEFSFYGDNILQVGVRNTDMSAGAEWFTAKTKEESVVALLTIENWIEGRSK